MSRLLEERNVLRQLNQAQFPIYLITCGGYEMLNRMSLVSLHKRDRSQGQTDCESKDQLSQVKQD